MSHVEEGTIVAIRDGALVDADATGHVEGCAHCGAALADARERSVVVDSALQTLDRPVDLERARVAVRARLDAAREEAGRSSRLGGHFGRAAAVLLLLAGAAAAMPGSPVRSWLAGPDPTPPPVVPVVEVQEGQGSESGIEVSVPDGRIEVVLSGVEPGTELEVVWTGAATARIAAGPGSGFAFAAGRAEARVGAGPVRVELPRDAPTVSVEVDGRTYLRRTSGSLEVFETTTERTDDRLVFVVPGR